MARYIRDILFTIFEKNCVMRKLNILGAVLIIVMTGLIVWFGFIDPKLHTKTLDGHDYVDLGLPSGTLWATCNLGATTPYDYGDFYAWGETTPKSEFNWHNYKYCGGKRFSITKYNVDTTYGPVVDTLTRLVPSDDAVTQAWGNKWCMPTNSQIRELVDCCQIGPTTYKGKRYCKIIGPNSQKLIIPYSGWILRQKHKYADSTLVIWTRDLRIEKSEMAYALILTWGQDPGWTRFTRNFGFAVRGVVNKKEE